MKPENKYKTYKMHVDRLVALNPSVFNKEFPKPLMIGVDKVIREKLNLSSRQVGALLHCWTQRKEYQFMLCSYASRHDLNGNSIEYLEPVERTLNYVRQQRLGHVIEFMKAFEKAYRYSAFQLLTPYQKQQMELEK